MVASDKTLLVVYHSQSGRTREMAESVIAGAEDDAIDGVSVVVADALTAEPELVLRADGVLLGTPENFGYMSGAMKHFFDRIYYPCLEHTQGLSYGLFIRAGNDGQGALTSVERIIAGLKWQPIGPAVIASGDFEPKYLEQCQELGVTMAAGLEAGIF